MMRRLSQTLAWLLVAIIVVLSVLPPLYRPVTDVGHNAEHVLIFLATGIAFGFGMPNRAWSVAIGLIAFAGLIELAQLFVPGRHARLADFAFDAAAAFVGLILSLSTMRVRCSSSRMKHLYPRARGGELLRAPLADRDPSDHPGI